MKTIVRRMLVIAAMVGILSLLTVGVALANPKAPTNGGNGGGMSGQCTGDAHERPTSCQSPNGVAGF